MDTYKARLWQMRHKISLWAEFVRVYREKHSVRMVMIMLTYKGVDDYKPGDINNFMKKMKQCLGKNLLAFAWVAEVQPDRGAIHYHIIILANKGTSIPKPDSTRDFYGQIVPGGVPMWGHGWSGIHTANTPFYLLKYMGKERQKDLSRYPKSCRLFAASIRGFSYEDKLLFRALTGKQKVPGVSGWEYKGSSVTDRYAREVLLPGDAEIDE